MGNIDILQKTIDYIEGEGNHFVTGKAYPTMIQFAGYDVTNKKYYVNFQLSADTGTLSTAKYYVEIFNDNKTLISKSSETGSYAEPKDATAAVINGSYSLNEPLSKNYSLIITVESFTPTTP